jgi:hypothetical protein
MYIRFDLFTLRVAYIGYRARRVLVSSRQMPQVLATAAHTTLRLQPIAEREEVLIAGQTIMTLTFGFDQSVVTDQLPSRPYSHDCTVMTVQ